MKVRTVSVGVTLTKPLGEAAVESAVAHCVGIYDKVAHALADRYEVQTKRVLFNRFDEYLDLSSPEAFDRDLAMIVSALKRHSVTFCNLGIAVTAEALQFCPRIVRAGLNCSALITEDNTLDVAKTMLEISTLEQGEQCFRFTASKHIVPHTPFFPAGFHEGPPCFSIGLENSDVLCEAFAGKTSLGDAAADFRGAITPPLLWMETVAEGVGRELGVEYGGIDTSINPSLDPAHSIVNAFESLGYGTFGGAGSLAITSAITEVLQSLPVKRTGYCGLMLPVCEDEGLAKRAGEGHITLTELLMLSSCCGVGLDTVPCGGDESPRDIAAVLLDVYALATKWTKPVSCRLLPIPGRSAGEKIEFQNPYLCAARLFKITR